MFEDGGGTPRHHVVVVNGYGCHLVPVLEKYLDKVIAFLSQNEVEHLVLCGGPTQQKTAPGMTEAKLMRDCIGERMRLPRHVTLADDTYTSFENMKWANRVIRGHFDGEFVPSYDPRYTDVTIFCETQRSLKVALLAWLFLPEYWQRTRILGETWERRPPFAELKATIADVLAFYVPGVAGYMRRKRMKRAREI